MKALIVGAGVTGCFTAARLMAKGVDVAVLARGDRATRLERDGLQLRDGLTGEEATVRLDVVRTPVRDEFEVAMVCVQATQRDALAPLLCELPGRPTIWYLGNTSTGYDRAIEQLGRDPGRLRAHGERHVEVEGVLEAVPLLHRRDALVIDAADLPFLDQEQDLRGAGNRIDRTHRTLARRFACRRAGRRL